MTIELAPERAAGRESAVIGWLSARVDGAVPERLLDLGAGRSRWFFADRDGRALAGIGEAAFVGLDGEDCADPDDVDRPFDIALTTLSRRVAAMRGRVVPLESPLGPPPAAVGGFAFDPATRVPPESAWAGWPTARFVIPEVQLRCERGEAWLIVCGGDRQSLERRLASVAGALATPSAASNPLSATALSMAGDFSIAAGRALAALSPELTKLTVAESGATSLSAPPTPLLLRTLAERQPGCFRYWIEPRAGRVLLGASPERLVAVHGAELSADALAGTAGRGGSAEEDSAIASRLAADEKERAEHASVVAHLRARLGDVGVIDAPAVPEVLRLAHVQHLHSPFRVALRESLPLLRAAALLHPTPAVCGVPTGRALAWLRASEGADRGWYGGAIGRVDEDGGELAVALRCALIDGTAARLHAGAGIVVGSVPDRERDEVRRKMTALADALGCA